jgi:hypothetical protein
MPFASGRYQSKLFNFLHRRSQKLSDRVGRTLRQVKVTASWSVQTLVYPVFVIIQKAVESSGKQFQASEVKKQLFSGGNNVDDAENYLNSDTPIIRVLETVKNLPSQQIALENLIKIHHISEISVRGIATSLENRKLVLVAENNQIMDILTPQQQVRSQNQIIYEIAEYWRYQKVNNNQLEHRTENLNLLPEIDRFLKKITGGNRGSLTEVAEVSSEMTCSDDGSKLVSLEFIDATVAKLEFQALVPVSRAALIVKNQGWKLIKVIQNKFQIFLYGNEITSTHNPNCDVSDLDNQERRIQDLRIQDLIIKAVNYFFGYSTTLNSNFVNQLSSRQTTAKSLRQSQIRKSKTLPGSQIKQGLITENHLNDTWLTFDDLFGEDVIFENSEESQIDNKISNQTENPHLSGKTKKQKRLKQYEIGGSLAIINKSSQALSRQQNKSHKLTVSKVSMSGISQIDSHENETKRKEILKNEQVDFIEIKASTISYDKHPLEVILEWLDSSLLWLEEKFVKVVRFFKSLLAK